MSLKQSFSAEDWSAVTVAPHLVATAVMMAGFSGLGGTAKEAFSVAQSLASAASSSSPLVREVAARDELSAVQNAVKEKISNLDQAQFKQQLNALALDSAKRAVEVVGRQVPDEAAAYKQWLMDIAFNVANAAKEGSFLGFGGERISGGEKEILDSLASTLGVQVRTTSV